MRGLSWNLLSPTWSGKILETELLAKHGRHAAFEAQRGEPKIMVSVLHSRFVLGPLLLQG